MSLPQTAAGIGAPGIDPSDVEMPKIETIASIFEWLGSSEPLVAAVLKALGGGKPRLRDLVYITAKDWHDTVAAVRLDGPDGVREMSAIERGQVTMVRRIARLRLGLTAIEESITAGSGPSETTSAISGACACVT